MRQSQCVYAELIRSRPVSSSSRRRTVAITLCCCVGAFVLSAGAQGPSNPRVRFVFTSDAHYGLRRSTFRTRARVSAHEVNAALVSDLNSLGESVGPVDFLVEGGDVANRAEAGEEIQPASVSWSQFKGDYIERLALRTSSGAKTPVYVVPGNHDASNAVGFYKTMKPATDKSAMVEIYNLMMAPARRSIATYEYATGRVLTSRDIGGVHFVFLTVWPDGVGRAWLARDLAHVSATTPVVIFAHDQPDAQSKHFTNPNGRHDINAIDRFENLLSDTLADGHTIDDGDEIEQAAWEDFVRAHPNITAYFHGNSNWNEFYDWEGPRHSVALHTFRVDSPMKGKYSESDETKLSFQVAEIDARTMTMTVRERLWNTATWGASTTVSVAPVTHVSKR
jgi:predicted MPP superfamily phosphohydrolase